MFICNPPPFLFYGKHQFHLHGRKHKEEKKKLVLLRGRVTNTENKTVSTFTPQKLQNHYVNSPR